MELRDKVLVLNEGEMLVIPAGIEHRPVAEEEVEILLFEPASTPYTGNIVNEKTKKQHDRL